MVEYEKGYLDKYARKDFFDVEMSLHSIETNVVRNGVVLTLDDYCDLFRLLTARVSSCKVLDSGRSLAITYYVPENPVIVKTDGDHSSDPLSLHDGNLLYLDEFLAFLSKNDAIVRLKVDSMTTSGDCRVTYVNNLYTIDPVETEFYYDPEKTPNTALTIKVIATKVG